MSYLICHFCLVKLCVLAKFVPDNIKYIHHEIQIYHKPVYSGQHNVFLPGETRQVRKG